MDKETKVKIIEGLRAPGNRGAIRELAKRAGCTTQWINSVFCHDENDDDLVLKASELLLELSAKRAEKAKQVQANLSAAMSNLQLATA